MTIWSLFFYKAALTRSINKAFMSADHSYIDTGITSNTNDYWPWFVQDKRKLILDLCVPSVVSTSCVTDDILMTED